MRVAILYNEPANEAALDDQDVLVQRDAIAAALAELGHTATAIGCTLDLDAARRALLAAAPDAVFNLVEALGGTDRLQPVATLLLDSLGLPYTGCPSLPLLETCGKLHAKRRLYDARLRTPPWLAVPHAKVPGGRYIIKAVWEHASVGLDETSVIDVASAAELWEQVARRNRDTGRPHFAEQFITGREFNLSLLASEHGPEVLPPAEIDFSAFPPGKPRIVDYRAKWEAGTFEYEQTPRRFDFPPSDHALLVDLADQARCCWELFGLRGYARVDFRVAEDGHPWILEINANPCLSPDAGYAAALERAGVRYADAIKRIVEDALR